MTKRRTRNRRDKPSLKSKNRRKRTSLKFRKMTGGACTTYSATENQQLRAVGFDAHQIESFENMNLASQVVMAKVQQLKNTLPDLVFGDLFRFNGTVCN